MVRKAEIKTVEGLRGGKGKLEMHHILKPEELNGHGRMYALVKSRTAALVCMIILVRLSRTMYFPVMERLSIMMVPESR